MKKIYLCGLMIFCLIFNSFGNELGKRTPIKFFSKIIEETKQDILKDIDGIYGIESYTKYKSSDSKTTCSVSVSFQIIVDSEEFDKITKNGVENIIIKSINNHQIGYNIWGFFFCRLEKIDIKYNVIKVKKVYNFKRKIEKEKVA